MKNYIITISILTIIFLGFPFADAEPVPNWVKNTAGWWATDAISETEFVNAIEFLINNQIIQVSSSQSIGNSQGVPDWVKNTAGWWATDAISETEFVNAIEFLIKNGVINVDLTNQCVNDFLKYFDDKKKIIQVCNEHKLSEQKELIPYDLEINFNSEGLYGKEFSKEKENNVYRVFVVGGSTIIGGQTTDNTTISNILQKLFDSQNIEFDIEVINAGTSGGNTISELNLIKSKLVNYEPDLIIMHDGWSNLAADYPVKKTLETYEEICKIASEEKFNVIITLQPIAGFSNKILTQQEKINSLTGQDHNGFQLIQAKSSYDYVARELTQLNNTADRNFENSCKTYDLRDVFDGVDGPIYWDQGHILHAGNIILAEKFYELVMKEIQPLIITDGKFEKIISSYNTLPVLSYLLENLGIDDDSFSAPLQTISTLENEKGNYFQLKNKFDGSEKMFVGKDLSNVNLENIDLKDQDLTGVNLSGQDLREIDITSIIIRGADLSYTNLEGQDLSKMDLRGVNFIGANLKKVNFTDAIFSKTIQIAGDCSDKNQILNVIKNFKCISIVIENESIRNDFTNADLTDAKFGSTKKLEDQMIYFTNFTNADLTNVSLESVQFFGTDFTNAKLNGISGKQIFVLESNFTNVEMENLEISEGWFQSTSFYNTNMSNGNFNSITFVDLNFTETELEGTEIILLNEIGNNKFNCKNNIMSESNKEWFKRIVEPICIVE